MSDIKLFSLASGKATELVGNASDLEKPLQTLIEKNLEVLLGIRFLDTEYQTGKTHAGRIDTLGLDENNCPVIIEYKRSLGENVINQGLFYLDWLMDHQAEFKLRTMEVLGKSAADNIDWSAPRLICIAADFTKYDAHAVQQINRNVELIRYRRFGKELLLFELANAVAATGSKGSKKKVLAPQSKGKSVGLKAGSGDKSVTEWMETLAKPQLELLASIEEYILSLGDDVQRKELKLYVAYKRLRNFATIVPQKSQFLLYLHVNPDEIKLIPKIGKDVRNIGHWGTGDLMLTISNSLNLELAKPLILRAYQGKSAPAELG